MGANINGNRVAYVYIPGKGYIALDRYGNAYTYDDSKGLNRDSFRKINLTDYDKQHIYKATQKDGAFTGLTGRDAQYVSDYWAQNY